MKRYELLDTLRGLAIISMIAFHTCWIMNHFGLVISDEAVMGNMFYIWERSICIGFITISGFSFSLGRDHLRSGLIVFLWGIVITLLTVLFIPGIRIIFGILTFLGTAMLVMIPIDRLFDKIIKGKRSAYTIIFALSFLLFLFTYRINVGTIGIKPFYFQVPKALYKGYLATFLGFMEPGFVSDDYFSFIPWFFVYICGYMLHKLIKGTKAEDGMIRYKIPGINFLGKHSLLIYLIHPVVIYVVVWLAA